MGTVTRLVITVNTRGVRLNVPLDSGDEARRGKVIAVRSSPGGRCFHAVPQVNI